jgi:hypothetical protein
MIGNLNRGTMELKIGHKFKINDPDGLYEDSIVKIINRIVFLAFTETEYEVKTSDNRIFKHATNEKFILDDINSGLWEIFTEVGDKFIVVDDITAEEGGDISIEIKEIDNSSKIINYISTSNTTKRTLNLTIEEFKNYIKNNIIIPLIENSIKIDVSLYPHKCTLCGAPAYINYITNQIDCSNCNGLY